MGHPARVSASEGGGSTPLPGILAVKGFQMALAEESWHRWPQDSPPRKGNYNCDFAPCFFNFVILPLDFKIEVSVCPCDLTMLPWSGIWGLKNKRNC
jgi:hypothetical protein